MYNGEKIYAVITAAGSGNRMGMKTPKQFIKVNNIPIIERTLNKFYDLNIFDKIFLVIRQEDKKFIEENLPRKFRDIQIIIGGKTREDSTFNAVKLLNDDGISIFHDGVRPFVSKDDIIRALNFFKGKNAVVFAVREKDTVKVVDNMKVISSPARKNIFRVQTPQIFSNKIIKEAYNKFYGKIEATDDSIFVSKLGEEVYIYESNYNNIKITTPEDLYLADIIAKEEDYCENR